MREELSAHSSSKIDQLLDLITETVETSQTLEGVKKDVEEIKSKLTDQIKQARLMIKSRVGTIVAPWDIILFCRADGSYSDVHLKTGNQFKYSYRLKILQNQLDSKIFYRVGRSLIININRVRSVENGLLTFDNHHVLPLANKQSKELSAILEKRFS